MNNATQPQSRKCIGGCGRKVSPPARKCPICRKSTARIARRRRSGGGRARGGSSFALLQSSAPTDSALSVTRSASACPWCAEPHTLRADEVETLADLAGNLELLADSQERHVAEHPHSDAIHSPFAAGLADVMARIEEFTQDARDRIEHIGLHLGYAHTDVGGNTYVASLETAKGCMGHPRVEAMLYQDGRTFYSFDIRNVEAVLR